MSSLDTLSASASPADSGTRTNPIALAIILALFILSAAISAQRKDITQGFDEVAHLSYVAHLQSTGVAWPALETMRLIDPQSFRFTGEANYLNHPPPFYWLLAKLGPTIEGHPGAQLAHRFINLLLVAMGVGALLAIGFAAGLSREQFYAYAFPIVFIPVLAPLAGAVNNDNLAFAGGALTTFAAWQVTATGRKTWFALALLGMIAAAWAKLTGLLLSAGLITTVCLYLIWRGRLPWGCLVVLAIGLGIAALPYIAFMTQYGSPVPNTPAQVALLEDGARIAGWADLPRKSFPAYVAHFVGMFIADWMPTLATRHAFHYAMLAVPVATLLCALAGFLVALNRVVSRRETALDVVVIGGALTIATTFAIHIGYSYPRHVATGFLMEAYPRYYLPLAAIIPLATLPVLTAIEQPRGRAALTGFLIAGPILFRLLGAPLE